MTTFRVAISPGSCAGLSESLPKFSALVAYPFAPRFIGSDDHRRVSSWVLDSGAFTAHRSGKEIDMRQLTEDALRWQVEDVKCTEVFALDVIGDPKASIANAVKQRAAGLNVIPCYHYGTPIEELRAIAADFDKVAIGGAAMLKSGEKMRFARNCFSAIWPKKIHGFAYAFAGAVRELPFHSVDSAVWVIQARKFRTIPGYGVCRGVDTGALLSIQIERVLRLENEARSRWAREMRLLNGSSE